MCEAVNRKSHGLNMYKETKVQLYKIAKEDFDILKC